MRNLFVFSVAALAAGCLLLGHARADGEKVPLDKLPKPVVDTLNAKYPKGVLKHAYKAKLDDKDVFEVGLNITKDKHIHALVTPEGKLLAIHRHLDPKDLPDKVAKSITAKYPKGKIDEAEEQADPDGKVTGYEVVVQVNPLTEAVLQLSPDGKILKAEVQSIKKEEKKDSK